MVRSIVLVGMMASGKSTVGHALAGKLERPLLDTDAMIERRAKARIPEIFQREGEEAFRRHEAEAVREAARRTRAVVSVGGGAVLDDDNVAALRASGVLVLLDAPAGVLAERVGAPGDRPLLAGDAASRLEQLLAQRVPRYHAVADHRVDASTSPEAVVAAIMDWLCARPDVLSAAERERCP